MAQQVLNIGSNANDGTGDNLRAAMIKVNENFTEVYAAPGVSDTLTFSGNEITAVRSNDDIVFNNILIDENSANLLKGSQVDYITEIIGSSFKITNPQSKSSCGCGESFSV